MVKSSVAHPENDANIPQTPPRNGPSSLNTNGGNTLTKKSSGVLVVDTSKDELPVWKRVTDPRGLPEQDASVSVKSRKTLKEEIIHNKVRRMPLRYDRIPSDLTHFIVRRIFCTKCQCACLTTEPTYSIATIQ